MISYRFAPISSQKGVLFFETPGISLASKSCNEFFLPSDFLPFSNCSGIV